MGRWKLAYLVAPFLHGFPLLMENGWCEFIDSINILAIDMTFPFQEMCPGKIIGGFISRYQYQNTPGRESHALIYTSGRIDGLYLTY